MIPESRHPTQMPPLYCNIMDGLPTDFARDVFLWAAERPGEDRMCYRAEKFAREVDHVVRFLSPLSDKSAEILIEQAKERGLVIEWNAAKKADLLGFIATRHANWRYGGNVKPTFLKPEEA